MGDNIDGGGPGVNYTPKVVEPYTRSVWRDAVGLWKFWPFKRATVILHRDIEIINQIPFKDDVDLVELARNANRHSASIDLRANLTVNEPKRIEVIIKFSHKKDAVMFRLGVP